MKKNIILTVVLALFISVTSCNKSDLDESIELNNFNEKSSDLLLKSNNKGFDAYGYNWNAHHFNGILFNAIVGDYLYNEEFFGDWEPYTGNDEEYLEKYPLAVYLPWDYRHINLVMHWNEALISKDGIYPKEWFDSNGWITFHYSGMDEDGKRWSQFQKMVAAKSTDSYSNGIWYDMNGNEIGVYSTWDELILIQVVNTGNIHPDFFAPYVNPSSSGIGKYKIH